MNYDSETYDTDSIEFDTENNNFNPEDIEDYRHENIVKTSIINGQYQQAKEQANQFGLNYEVFYFKVKGGVA